MAPRSSTAPSRRTSIGPSRSAVQARARLLLGRRVRVNVNSGRHGQHALRREPDLHRRRQLQRVDHIRAVFGKKAGSATVNRTDDAALRAVVQRAEALARLAPDDPELLPELGPQTYDDIAGTTPPPIARSGGSRRRGAQHHRSAPAPPARVHRISRGAGRLRAMATSARTVRVAAQTGVALHHHGAHHRRHRVRLGRGVLARLVTHRSGASSGRAPSRRRGARRIRWRSNRVATRSCSNPRPLAISCSSSPGPLRHAPPTKDARSSPRPGAAPRSA
jgi:hypothetical protein